MIMTRTKCREEDPLMLSLALNVAFVATGNAGTLLGASSLGGSHFTSMPWSSMSVAAWGAMCLLAVSVLIGEHRCGVRIPSRAALDRRGL
jgi:hypothetical protein